MEKDPFKLWLPGTVACSHETIEGERYIVFKFPAWKPLNEVLAVVRDQWMKAEGRGARDKRFDSLMRAHGLNPKKTRFVGDIEHYELGLQRREVAQKKRSAAVKGKPKKKRSELSKKTHNWIKSRYKALKPKFSRATTKKDLAEKIGEELEAIIREADIEKIPRPFKPMTVESIQKVLPK